MDLLKDCGCNTYRSCLVCEKKLGIGPKANYNLDIQKAYVYCPFCNLAYKGWDVNSYLEHPNHTSSPISFPGVFIKLNFISEQEEKYIIDNVDNYSWKLSQSGRRKQNYGPKCNFMKRQCKIGNFSGFPIYTKFIQKRFNEISLLNSYQTIEQCFLEYSSDVGASIEEHIDDCWVWGERILTVNLLSDSVLTMTHYDLSVDKNAKRFNLGTFREFNSELYNELLYDNYTKTLDDKEIIVRIPMPRLSLLVLYNKARYGWEHRILRQDIVNRRVCIAYREFTPIDLNDKDKIVNMAQVFF